jgi:hypothetical protein
VSRPCPQLDACETRLRIAETEQRTASEVANAEHARAISALNEAHKAKLGDALRQLQKAHDERTAASFKSDAERARLDAAAAALKEQLLSAESAKDISAACLADERRRAVAAAAAAEREARQRVASADAARTRDVGALRGEVERLRAAIDEALLPCGLKGSEGRQCLYYESLKGVWLPHQLAAAATPSTTWRGQTQKLLECRGQATTLLEQPRMRFGRSDEGQGPPKAAKPASARPSRPDAAASPRVRRAAAAAVRPRTAGGEGGGAEGGGKTGEGVVGAERTTPRTA